MKFSIVFVSFALFLLCVFTTTSNADSIALEKGSAVFPFESSIAHRIKRELESLHDELAVPRTRVARQAPTDPGNGGGISGLFRSALRALALIPIGLITAAVMILNTISQAVAGVANGIVSILNNMKTWLQSI